MKELVSIIVPVYRAEAYLAETIAMVQAQTWQEWELLLIDDCSPERFRGGIHWRRRAEDRTGPQGEQ